MTETKPFIAVMHHAAAGYFCEYTSTIHIECVEEFWKHSMSMREEDRPTWAHLICKKTGHMAATYSKTLGFQDLH